jgi:hypothetical protein
MQRRLSVDVIPGEMAPTLTPPIPRIIKHQLNHGIPSHLPTPILTDPTMAICSFQHKLLLTISLDLMLLHVEGVDSSAAYIRAISGVGAGAMFNHIHQTASASMSRFRLFC